jgi:TPR repeat protein
LIVTALPAHAGLNQGLMAYDKADYATARKELMPLAEQGHAQAQFRLGKMANLGQGLPPDKKEAAKWFHLAAEQGLAAAQGALGYLCLVGDGVSQNNDLALKWTRKAALQGDATAQFNLSVMHGEQFGIKKDPVESLKWLRKAADQRHVEALNTLGSIHEKGKDGARPNPVFAYVLFAAAAEKGNSVAAAKQKTLGTGLSAKDLQAAQALSRKWKPGTSFVHVAGSGASL